VILVSRFLVATVRGERSLAVAASEEPEASLAVAASDETPATVPYTTKHGTKSSMRTDNIVDANKRRAAARNVERETRSEPEPQSDARSSAVGLGFGGHA
jgi:hypothetical protein